MTGPTDHFVWRVLEDSTIVRTIERGARAVRSSAAGSRAAAAGGRWFAAAAAWPGHLLLSAALTHIVLMIVVARPVSWMWAILPSIAVAIGLVLVAFSRPFRIEQ
jgi:hypothetical protein